MVLQAAGSSRHSVVPVAVNACGGMRRPGPNVSLFDRLAERAGAMRTWSLLSHALSAPHSCSCVGTETSALAAGCEAPVPGPTRPGCGCLRWMTLDSPDDLCEA